MIITSITYDSGFTYDSGYLYGSEYTGLSGLDFQERVITHLNRSDMATIVTTFCAMAVDELESNCLWFQLTASSVATASTVGYATLPVDYIKDLRDGFRDTSGASLEKESWAKIRHWQLYSTATDEPDYFAIADKIYLYPIPDAVYALRLQYFRKLGFPADTAINGWTNDVWDLTFWAVLKRCYLYLNDSANMMKAETEMAKCLVRYKHRSGKITGKGRTTYRDF